MKEEINKLHIRENWYSDMIRFLNKAKYNEKHDIWYVETKYLLKWNQWQSNLPKIEVPVFVKKNNTIYEIEKSYYIENNLLQKCIIFWKENYEKKWISK